MISSLFVKENNILYAELPNLSRFDQDGRHASVCSCNILSIHARAIVLCRKCHTYIL